MKTEQFLRHYGITSNPFSEEDAQTDTVFKRGCLWKIHHPAWDKFFDVMVDWQIYLASPINDLIPGSAADAMYAVGVIEIAAGVAVAAKPRYGAYLVAAWLAGIIVNLLIVSDYYDIALRDFGLMLGALTLARLASRYDPPGLGLPARS